MGIYQIRSCQGYLFTQGAPDEKTAHTLLESKLGFSPLDTIIGEGLIYGNIDRECDCMICENRIKCPHSGTSRRFAKEKGGLELCPKLKEV